eukprot:2430889-Pyramimonas_sp.AAC.1
MLVVPFRSRFRSRQLARSVGYASARRAHQALAQACAGLVYIVRHGIASLSFAMAPLELAQYVVFSS